MKHELIKSTETRNDCIAGRKSLLWHLTIYNMPMYCSSLSYAVINKMPKNFLTVIQSFLVSILFINPYFIFNL